MKKILIGIVSVVIVGVGYWLLSPLWRTERVSEAVPLAVSRDDVSGSVNETVSKELFTGTFSGFDRLHQGSGTTKILQVADKTYVRFESDFTVSNGPDLYVGFGKDGTYIAGSEVGTLKGNVGAQNYELPAGFASDRFNEVYVWCRAFSVPFAKAKLVPAS